MVSPIAPLASQSLSRRCTTTSLAGSRVQVVPRQREDRIRCSQME